MGNNGRNPKHLNTKQTTLKRTQTKLLTHEQIELQNGRIYSGINGEMEKDGSAMNVENASHRTNPED